jgi:nucleoside-diphosphate-sugar epimerase
MKRLLVAGFGDIARRAAPRLARRYSLQRLSRALGADLDFPQTLALEAADAVLHCVPPPGEGETDSRTAHLLAALENGRILPARMVYVSTSGVYGDCAGARVDESRPPAPRTARARRRLDAERRLAQWCSLRGIPLVILRAPGIYAADRLPLARLRAGMPVLLAEHDVYTNHIHAEDLAAIVSRALEEDAPPGVYNASDDSEVRMADWFDFLAERHGLPRPPRVSREQAKNILPEAVYSFMSESRRLDNGKLKRELGIRLLFPTIREGLSHEQPAGADQPA